MEDPLSVERAELLGMIEELKRLYAGLDNPQKGVSNERSTELRRLRKTARRTKSPFELKLARVAANVILKAATAELIKRLFEALNYLKAAAVLRSRIDDHWRNHKITTPFGGTHATRARRKSRYLGADAIACRSRETRTDYLAA